MDKHEPWQSEVSIAPGERRSVVSISSAFRSRLPSRTSTRPSRSIRRRHGRKPPDARPQSGLARQISYTRRWPRVGSPASWPCSSTVTWTSSGPCGARGTISPTWPPSTTPAYVHIGASPQGYAALSAVGIPTLDESARRSRLLAKPARYAPHNAYTSTEPFRSAMDKGSAGKVTPGGLAGFTFRDGRTPVKGEKAEDVRSRIPRLDTTWSTFTLPS